MRGTSLAVPAIARAIHILRGHRVLLDADLAVLYGVKTGALNRAVKRNHKRFPEDFMFQLTAQEASDLKCQTGTSSSHGGRRRSRPYAFTQEGVAMLSGVLNSPRAIAANVEIMRAFVRLREVLAQHADLAKRLDALEAKLGKHHAENEHHFTVVFDAIRRLIQDEDAGHKPRKIGFEVP